MQRSHPYIERQFCCSDITGFGQQTGHVEPAFRMIVVDDMVGNL